jgi:mono/diheme cytochrome c family protein
MKRIPGWLVVVALGGAVGCGESGAPEAPVSPEVARGKQIYQTVCVACHASDPSLPGSLGPPVAGASQELLEAKVIHGTYPPGYTPKRDSRAMVPLPHLQADIPALAAYLQSVAKGS